MSELADLASGSSYRLIVTSSGNPPTKSEFHFELENHLRRFARGKVLTMITGLDSVVDDWAYDFATRRGLKRFRLGPSVGLHSKRALFCRNERMVSAANGLLLFNGDSTFVTRHLLDAANFQGLNISLVDGDRASVPSYITHCA